MFYFFRSYEEMQKSYEKLDKNHNGKLTHQVTPSPPKTNLNSLMCQNMRVMFFKPGLFILGRTVKIKEKIISHTSRGIFPLIRTVRFGMNGLDEEHDPHSR